MSGLGGSAPIIPPELVGIPAATLQTWLGQAQTALHNLQIGGQAQTVSYGQGDGQKSVTYTRANLGALQMYVRQLQAALGNTCYARRAIRVGYSTRRDWPWAW